MSTPDPSLPCGDPTARQTFAFLDCSDIFRIRSWIENNVGRSQYLWRYLTLEADEYRKNLPTSLDNESSNDTFWNAGRYYARSMGLIYLVTGDKAYARDIQKLVELAVHETPSRPVPGDPWSWLMSNPAHGGTSFQSLLFAYLTIRDTQIINSEERQRYDSFFVEQARRLLATTDDLQDIPISSDRNRNVPFGSDVAAATIALAFKADYPDAEGLYNEARQRVANHLAIWFDSDGG